MQRTSRQELFASGWALQNGNWKRLSEIGWSLSDQGFLHGAILVERLRTYQGVPFCVSEHEARLANGAMAVGIVQEQSDLFDTVFIPSEAITSFEKATVSVLERNQAILNREEDVAIVWLLSPGDMGWDRTLPCRPQWVVHLMPLPWLKLHQMYRLGSPVDRSATQNIPAACWSPSIKSRSRLHYYLAERQSSHPDVIPLLLNQHGFVTECPIGNLLILDSKGRLLTPQADDILGGVSLAFLRRLANEEGFEVVEEDLTWDAVAASSEVLLTGTTAGLWPAASIAGRMLSSYAEGSLYEKLALAWERVLGYSYRDQAERHA